MMKKVLVIVGPTASGKTKLSLEIAKKFQAEIINGDSVQLYKGLDIGSAKVSVDEQKLIPHHLLDIFDPKELKTVYDYQKLAREKIEVIDLPLIVGGTGLYIQSTLFDYEFNEQKISVNLEELTNDELFEELIKLDPYIEIDRFNRRRLISALKLALNNDLRSKKQNKHKPLYDACIIYLDLERSMQEDIFRKRLDMQLEQGFIEEVEDLRKHGIHLNMIGYRELDQYLDGTISLEEAKEQIINKTKKLAKRQKTWFKNQMHVHMFDALAQDLFTRVQKQIEDFLKE